MKRSFLATALLTLVLVTFTFIGAHAQVSGDKLCGSSAQSECSVIDFAKVVKGALGLIIIIGLPLLTVFISYRFVMAWFAREQGNSSAYQEALKKSLNATAGFFLIVVLFGGGFLVILKFLGVQNNGSNNPLKILELFSEAPSPLVVHAYAAEGDACSSGGSFGTEDANGNCVTDTTGGTAGNGNNGQTNGGAAGNGVTGSDTNGGTAGNNGNTTTGGAAGSGSGGNDQLLPNFMKASTLYDFIIDIIRVFMRFFIYPALIVAWVWTGFSFVQAQGNPDGINKAKKWLFRAFISTVVIFMLQAFLTAIRGTVEQILPGSTNTTQNS